jgi:hypothetical protein
MVDGASLATWDEISDEEGHHCGAEAIANKERRWYCCGEDSRSFSVDDEPIVYAVRQRVHDKGRN